LIQARTHPFRLVNEQAITIRHLLEHVAGGAGWNNNGTDGTGDPMFQLSSNTSVQLINWVLKNRTISDAPGNLYSYSNFGWVKSPRACCGGKQRCWAQMAGHWSAQCRPFFTGVVAGTTCWGV
jgi:hypothetical protein